jgi:hypothetical protein
MKATTLLFCAWVLMHPYYAPEDASRLRLIWSSVWDRNTWVIARIFSSEEACRSVEYREFDAWRNIEPQTPYQSREWAARVRVTCLPSELIVPPADTGQRPNPDALRWHNEHVFKG